MENVEILNGSLGLVSAIGTLALYKYNVAQSEKIRAELIEKFEQALSKNMKHAVCELFRMIHGLTMDYEDILAICGHNKCSKIIRALQKTPGLVKHENGCIQYTKRFEKRLTRLINKIITHSIAYGAAGVAIVLVLLTLFVDFTASSLLQILAMIAATVVLSTWQFADINHDRMVESLIDGTSPSGA